MKPAMILVCLALLLFAWMFRYEVSGHVELGTGDNPTHSRPVLLDRWTGKTYIYVITYPEKRVIGDWAEIRPGASLGLKEPK